jgi:hypothetical protein
MQIVILYLLIGTVLGYLLDRVVTSVDEQDKFTWDESLWAITLWPLLLVVFIHAYVRGFLESFRED